MPERSDRSVIQGRIRHELQFPLDEHLPEHVSQRCFISGDDAWSVRYTYSITADFPDETIYCGTVTAKAKKKFAEFIHRNRHEYLFVVRVRSRYDVEVVLKHIEDEET